MPRSLLAEPINVSAILREHNASEARMVAEYHEAFDAAQRALQTPAPLVDDNGVAFAEGQRVVSQTFLWRSSKVPGERMKMMVAGWRGVLRTITETSAWIDFEGIAEPYPIRRDRLKTVLLVVPERAA